MNLTRLDPNQLRTAIQNQIAMNQGRHTHIGQKFQTVEAIISAVDQLYGMIENAQNIDWLDKNAFRRAVSQIARESCDSLYDSY